MLNVANKPFLLSVIILNVVMPSVVAPLANAVEFLILGLPQNLFQK